ncbi:MAG TPA: hypothetical protein PK199_03135 [Bacteroidales bacterium]|nr:hypothetical protein [Bacteroidales bacterium]
MRIIYICIVLICCSFEIVCGQQITTLYAKGVEYYEKEQYDEAIDVFENILEHYTKIPQVYLYAGNSYKQNLQYHNAIKKYEELSNTNPGKYPEIYLHLAQLYEMLENTTQARYNYNEYIQYENNNSTNVQYAKKKLFVYSQANKISYNDSIQLQRDTVSPFFHNFGVSQFHNAIIYNGVLQQGDTVSRVQFFSPQPVIQRYFSDTACFNSYSVTDFCTFENPNRYIFNKRNKASFSEFPNITAAVFTENIGFTCFRDTLIDIGNYLFIHPHIEWFRDSLYIFFASNLPQGYGGMDIWYSMIDSLGTLSKPINAGNIINSEFDEICPFYHASDSLLYFSSNKPESIGGFDIFAASMKPSVTNSIQLDKPINSSYNDLYFRHFDTIAYITSNRIAKHIDSSEFFPNSIFYYTITSIKETEISIANDTTFEKFKPFNVYFDFDKPHTRETLDYAEQYALFESQQIPYIQQYADSIEKYISYMTYKKQIQDFYTLDLQKGKTTIDSLLHLIINAKPLQDTLWITLQAYTGSGGTIEYNTQLAQRRIESVMTYITRNLEQASIPKEVIEFRILPHVLPNSTNSITNPQKFDIHDARLRKVEIGIEEKK